MNQYFSRAASAASLDPLPAPSHSFLLELLYRPLPDSGLSRGFACHVRFAFGRRSGNIPRLLLGMRQPALAATVAKKSEIEFVARCRLFDTLPARHIASYSCP